MTQRVARDPFPWPAVLARREYRSRPRRSATTEVAAKTRPLDAAARGAPPDAIDIGGEGRDPLSPGRGARSSRISERAALNRRPGRALSCHHSARIEQSSRRLRSMTQEL